MNNGFENFRFLTRNTGFWHRGGRMRLRDILILSDFFCLSGLLSFLLPLANGGMKTFPWDLETYHLWAQKGGIEYENPHNLSLYGLHFNALRNRIRG